VTLEGLDGAFGIWFGLGLLFSDTPAILEWFDAGTMIMKWILAIARCQGKAAQRCTQCIQTTCVTTDGLVRM